MHRHLVLAAALVAASLAPRAARAARPPLQSDIDRCTLKAEDTGRANVSGRLRLQLLARANGRVFAAFVANDAGIGDRLLERCVLYTAMIWELPRARLDYAWPYPISFTPGVADHSLDARDDPQRMVFDNGSGQGRASVHEGDLDHPPAPEPLDVAAAQATLEVAEDATASERALALLAVRRYAPAEEAFRAALRADPRDAMALRGLAQALAESGKDPGEARTVASRLVELQPASEQGHEAMLRVCLAAGDDSCVFESFRRANAAPDLSLRWLILRDELLSPAQAAAERLRRRARGEVVAPVPAAAAPGPVLAASKPQALLAPAAPAARRWEVGLRTGFWMSFGESTPDAGTTITAGHTTPQGNLISATDFSVANSFPVALDVGLRVHPLLQLGGYFQYASAASHLCPSETACSGNELHGGAAARFHPAPEATLDPWIGLTAGYGTRRLYQRSSQWGDVTAGVSGPEMGIEAGLAFRLTGAMQFGPFVGLGISRYRGSANAARGSQGGQDSSQSIDRGWSGSSLLGIRLGYGFPG